MCGQGGQSISVLRMARGRSVPSPVGISCNHLRLFAPPPPSASGLPQRAHSKFAIAPFVHVSNRVSHETPFMSPEGGAHTLTTVRIVQGSIGESSSCGWLLWLATAADIIATL